MQLPARISGELAQWAAGFLEAIPTPGCQEMTMNHICISNRDKLNVSLTQNALCPSNMRESMMEGKLEYKETRLNQFKYLALKVVQNHMTVFLEGFGMSLCK